MNDKVIYPWSYSALESFENCPKKFYEEKISKRYKQQGTTEIQQYGKDAHKFFENFMLNGTPLPMDLKHHQPILGKLRELPGDKLPEQKLAINKKYEPTGFFDKDVYARAVIDFVCVDHEASTAVIADWKFGKMRDTFDQIQLMIAIFSCYEPEIERYEGMYYWAKDKKTTRLSVNRNEIVNIWDAFMPRVEALEDAVVNDEFPAIQNWLCRSYCPVSSCPHNGE